MKNIPKLLIICWLIGIRTQTKTVKVFCANRYTISQYCGSGETRTHNSITYYCFSRAAPHPAGSLPFNFIQYVNELFIFLLCYNIRNLFPVAKPK